MRALSARLTICRSSYKLGYKFCLGTCVKTIIKGGLALAAFISLGLALAGCEGKQLPEALSSADDRAVCSALIGDLQAGPAGDADILNRLNPQLSAQFTPMLPRLHALTPSGARASSRLVEASFKAMASNGGQSSRDAYLAYEVDQGQRRVLIRFDIFRQAGSVVINGLYISPLYVPAEQLNAFPLAGRSFVQYAFLALAIAACATIVASEFVLLLTGGIRRKWPWAIGCLFGYGQIWIAWSNGAIGFQPINIQLLGAFALKGGLLEPWRIGFGIPLVSIIFLLRRKRLQESDARRVTEKATAAF
jgi:hypothetical protein